MSGKKGKFERLYQNQSLFQFLVEKKKPIDDPIKFQYHITGMIEELGEVLKVDKRWKTHRNTSFDNEEKLEELADCYITLMNISLWSGYSAEQVLNKVADKIKENNRRLAEKRKGE